MKCILRIANIKELDNHELIMKVYVYDLIFTCQSSCSNIWMHNAIQLNCLKSTEMDNESP